MTNTTRQPCAQALGADCYKAHPAWARQAFAYRLIHLLAPAEITRRLPKALRLALIAPGVDIPPGVTIPDGAVVAPGAVVPPDWTAPDPDPGPIVVDPAAPSPPDVAPSPWITWSMFPPIVLEPALQDTGPVPPLYVAPWEPGPPTPPGIHIPAAGETQLTIIGSTSDGLLGTNDLVWATARDTPGSVSKNDFLGYATVTMQGRLQLGSYWCGKAFLYFDLSSIPAGSRCVNVVVAVIGYLQAMTQVCIQEGTQDTPLVGGNWHAHTGPRFATITWQSYSDPDLNTNLFDLDAAGRAYVEGQLGGTAKFCLREYTKEFLNITPTGPEAGNGMYFANHGVEKFRPYIVVTYK